MYIPIPSLRFHNLLKLAFSKLAFTRTQMKILGFKSVSMTLSPVILLLFSLNAKILSFLKFTIGYHFLIKMSFQIYFN